jgi:ABC-2 type transport system permease protein
MQSEMIPVTQVGWRMGFGNLLRKELQQWFGTRTWIRQGIMWSVILGGMIFLVISESTAGPEENLVAAVTLYSIMGSIFASIVIVIFSSGAIIGERERGTAEWVLSKPVSRTSFVVAKLISGSISYAVSLALIPGCVVYLILNFGISPLSPVSFLLGLGPMILWYMFIHFLCICLGTFFNHPGPVAGPAAISLFLVNAFDISGIGAYTPWTLSFVSSDLMQGLPMTPLTPVISTIVILILLFGIAVWRFGKEEF